MTTDRLQKEIDAAKQGDSDYRNSDAISGALGTTYHPPENASPREMEIFQDHHDHGPNATKNPGK